MGLMSVLEPLPRERSGRAGLYRIIEDLYAAATIPAIAALLRQSARGLVGADATGNAIARVRSA
jgi:hypothetical protein